MKTDTILTKAQSRVALCYVLGMLGKEAADRLCVSYNTIIRHTQNIYDVTGVPHSINSIVSWWYRTNYNIDLGKDFDCDESLKMLIKEFGRKFGAIWLLWLFCTFTFVGDGDITRTVRANRTSQSARTAHRCRKSDNTFDFSIDG